MSDKTMHTPRMKLRRNPRNKKDSDDSDDDSEVEQETDKETKTRRQLNLGEIKESDDRENDDLFSPRTGLR